jgi:hypothetical protein
MGFEPTEWTGETFVVKIEDGPLPAALEIQGRLKNAKFTGMIESIERTAGSGRRHRQKMPGIKDTGLEITFNVLATALNPAWLRLDEVYTITLGFPNLTAGNPGHKQKFFLKELPVPFQSGRGEVQYSTKWEPYDEPIIDFFEEGVLA